jgi:hypothetical protein
MRKKDLVSARLPWLVLGILALASMSASGPQCTQVGDRATAPREGALDEQGVIAECIHSCNDDAKESRDAERRLHTDNVKACAGDSDCLADEEARHEAAMDAIAAASKACKASCHDQGGGEGGQ